MISIIIPIYNTARWLPQCLESVLSQDFKDIEVILVDDASADNSLSICRRYADKDSRVVVVAKPENEGVELARRTGYLQSHGEYVMYIDSDDWLDDKYVLSKMVAKANEKGADYVEIGINRVFDRRKLIAQRFVSSGPRLIDQPELFEKYYLSFFGVNLLSVNMWGKLYRKSILDKADIKPIGICMGEDLYYNIQLFPHLRRICLLNEGGYNYRYGGLTCKYNPKLLSDMKRLYLLKEAMIDKYGYDKAKDWARIELKNVLKSDICQRIAYGNDGGKRAVINAISAEINDPIYAKLSEVSKASGFWEGPFVKAFMAKDAEKIYDICLGYVRRERPKRLLKQAMFKLFNAFN